MLDMLNYAKIHLITVWLHFYPVLEFIVWVQKCSYPLFIQLKVSLRLNSFFQDLAEIHFKESFTKAG